MKEIVLQYQEQIIKAALFENGQLIEVHEEETGKHGTVGNIYRGKVMNVLPGMQAAFVDIGMEKNAFLFVGDAVPLQYDQEDKLPPDPKLRIEEILKPGQELLVQVTKEAVGTKGPRITTNITIPGRYGVLLPTGEYVGVSRKITDEQERDRLRELAQMTCPPGMGLIVRTLGEGVQLPELEQDVKDLVALWEVLAKKIPKVSVPGLVHHDVNLVSRMIRDWVDQDVKAITVNHPEIGEEIRQALLTLKHPAANHVYLKYKEDIFTDYGVEDEIRKALRPKVWLKNGGYLIIQQTEALVVIDVNTGKYVGEDSLQETILQTNQEAARVIARQIRLRNLGGIIIIDFIDMSSDEDKQMLLDVLESAVAKDRVKCQVVGLTQLGLVEMTRKKVGQTLEVRYGEKCPSCEGRGFC